MTLIRLFQADKICLNNRDVVHPFKLRRKPSNTPGLLKLTTEHWTNPSCPIPMGVVEEGIFVEKRVS